MQWNTPIQIDHIHNSLVLVLEGYPLSEGLSKEDNNLAHLKRKYFPTQPKSL